MREKLKELIKEQLLFCCLEPADNDNLEITAEVSLDIIIKEIEKSYAKKSKYYPVLCPECRRKGEMREDILAERLKENNYIKIDPQDIQTLINMLSNKPKIVKYIREYIYDSEIKKTK